VQAEVLLRSTTQFYLGLNKERVIMDQSVPKFNSPTPCTPGIKFH